MSIRSPFEELKQLRRWWQPPDSTFAMWAILIMAMTAAIAVVMPQVRLVVMPPSPPPPPGVPSFNIDLWSPSTAFVCAVVPFAVLSGRLRWGVIAALVAYGATFPYWGMFFAFEVPTGPYGIPQAVLTAVVLRFATRSWITAAASILAITVTTLANFVLRSSYSSIWIEIVSVVWNTTLAASMGLWCLWSRQRARVLSLREVCGCCLYDLAGITTGICPECGTRVPVAGAGEVSPAPPLLEDAGGQHVREVPP